MSSDVLQILVDISTDILIILGLSYLPLVILIGFRAGQMRGLTADNMSERLWDLCFDTLKEQISDKMEELLLIVNLELPPGLAIQDLATHLHHDSESLEQLLTILKNLTELGIRGILLNRRNIPIMSMPIESMLLAVNSNFLVFSVSSDDMMGQSFASLVSTVAAAESAIGLAIFVITFRVRGTIAVEFINSIQG
ncbi:hypothetical protein VNO77_47144 [Canavalia gladiata]